MSTNQDLARPSGARMRRPEAMERGHEYTLTKVAQEKSKFPNKKTGQDVYKTLAVYDDFGMTFFTYMPYKYDDKDDEYFESINRKIKDGKDIRVVFYGKIGSSYELEILDDGQTVNQTKLEGVQRIESLESGDPAPKRRKTE